jgi:hypothetical protein
MQMRFVIVKCFIKRIILTRKELQNKSISLNKLKKSIKLAVLSWKQNFFSIWTVK